MTKPKTPNPGRIDIETHGPILVARIDGGPMRSLTPASWAS